MFLDGAELRVGNLVQAQAKLGIPDLAVLTDAYAIANIDPPSRTFDAQTATLAETRDTLATLIADLKAAGVIP